MMIPDYEFIYRYILSQFDDGRFFSEQDIRDGLTLVFFYHPNFKQEQTNFNPHTSLDKIPTILNYMVADGLLIRHAPDPLFVRYAVVRHV